MLWGSEVDLGSSMAQATDSSESWYFVSSTGTPGGYRSGFDASQVRNGHVGASQVVALASAGSRYSAFWARPVTRTIEASGLRSSC